MDQAQARRFKTWQWRTIIGSMIGYSVFYFVRKNFSFAIPGLTAEYGISKTTFGLIISIVGLVYGVSKFVNGIIADRSNARWHMVAGLSVSAAVNILFGCGAVLCGMLTGQAYGAEFVSRLVILFGVLLVINNLFQGCGFPPCNRLLTHWVPPAELATKMSVWNTSHSIGALIISILCGYIMGHMGTDMTGDAAMRARIVENTASVTAGLEPEAAAGYIQNALSHVGAWQWAFLIPAAIAVLGVVFIIFVLRDTPKSVGLPELGGTGRKAGEKESGAEFREFVKKRVFRNPMIWALTLADFFVYVVRFAVLDWGPSFLQESCGLSAAMSGWTVAIFEAFGITGMLLSGWITDRFFDGRAQRTCALCMAGVVGFTTLFFFLRDNAHPVVLLLVLAMAGFFLYGPQALIGVVASNHATRRAASTAVGLIGLVSYVSVLISGAGFGFVSDRFGWKWVFITMIVMAVIGFIVMASMWNTRRDNYEPEIPGDASPDKSTVKE